MPAAEVDVSPELVRKLLNAQHPDLADLPITVLSNGWDNVIYRLGDDLLIRLPRRSLGAEILLHEQRWLPLLAQRLPLPVPAPVRVGRPAAGYPWPWSVVPYLPGEVAARTPPADPSHAAASLGRFLNSLHTPADPDAPVNQFRGVPLAERDDTVQDNMSLLTHTDFDTGAVSDLWETAKVAPPHDGPRLWLHGDLHPANILVDHGQLSGVIDFGDITSGDPACDLSVAWMLFHEAAHREAFWTQYARADASTRVRARGWALNFSLVFLAYSADNPLMAGIGRRTYRNVLSGR
ncbi:MAG TPA: aminoglycoside phosphotransferase family protein [Streptosporangiaceae bacterium]